MRRKRFTGLLAAGAAVFLSAAEILSLFSYADNSLLYEETVEEEETASEEGFSEALGADGEILLEDFLWPDENGKYSVTVSPATDGAEYCIYVLPGIYRSVEEIPFETAIRNLIYIDQKKAADGQAVFDGFEPSRTVNATVVIGAEESAGGTRIFGYLSKNIFRVAGYADKTTHKELPSFISVEAGKSFEEIKALLPEDGAAMVVSEYQDPIYVPVSFTWAENEDYDPEATGSVFRFVAEAAVTDPSYPPSFGNILKPYSADIGIPEGSETVMMITAEKTKVIYKKDEELDLSDITVSEICYNGMVLPAPEFTADDSSVRMDIPGEYEITIRVNYGERTLTTGIKIRVEDTGESSYCTVSFDTRGGNRIAPLIVRKAAETVIDVIPEKTGYTFDGWYFDSSETRPMGEKAAFTEDAVLYAGWIDNGIPALSSIEASLGFVSLKTGEYPDPSAFVVKAHYEDGSVLQTEDYLENSDDVDYETPGRKEILFSYTENGITKTCIVSFMLYDGEEEGLCSVSFDTGCDTSIPDMAVVKGDLITAPDVVLSKENARFLGWYLDGKLWDFKKNRVSGDMTLAAGWAGKAVSEEDEQIFCFLSDPGDFEYTGKAIKPSVTVMDGSGKLLGKSDYSLSYRNNTKISTEQDTACAVVTAKGNYQGSVEVPFKITKRSLLESSGITITLKDQYDYKAKGYTPAPVVKYGKTKLKKDRDYTLSYEKLNSPDGYSGTMVKAPLKEAGYYLVRITGKGNYDGTDSRVIRIAGKGLKNLSKAYVTIGKSGKTVAYTGNSTNIDNEVTVKLSKKGTPLEYGQDYELIYPEDTQSAGAKTVIVRAKKDSEKCYGEKKITYTVSGVKISSAKVVMKASSAAYTGDRITDRIESVKVKVTKSNRASLQAAAGEDLALNSWYTLGDSDYTAVYTDCVNAGTATVTLEGTGVFTNSVKKKFKIGKASLKSASMLLNVETDVLQNKNGAKADVSLVYDSPSGEVTLTEGRDYTLKYGKHTSAGENATVKITGKGNFKDSRTEKYTIIAKSLRSADIRIAVTNPARKDGAAGNFVYKPSVAVYDDGVLLKENKDYTVDRSLCVTEETVKGGGEGGYVRILEKQGGSYTGETMIRYRVVGRSLSDKACVIEIDDQIYTGSPIVFDLSKPEDRAMFRAEYKTGENTSEPMKAGRDFEIVSISKNLKAGTATVTLRGLGDYSGTVKKSFTIRKQRLS
ncbi:MAG: InlB B-repeat-containing protein [Lachnospiraceae bacterium]|nr:InlB B-repeat-containing protein [Lachnospiraceae bacterium]